MKLTLSEGCHQLHEWFESNPDKSKTDFAEEIDISKQSLSHILSGRRQVTLPQACAIHKKTGIVHEDWLVF